MYIDIIMFQGMPPLDVRIKWPNDLYLDGLKVGGVLCTSTYKSQRFNVSVGNYSFLLMVPNCKMMNSSALVFHFLFWYPS